jgi:hypothetical protein
MDREELSKVLSQPMQPQMVPHLVGILKSNNIGIEDLFEISLNGKKEISFRAAWMLEYLMVNEPQDFLTHLPTLFNALPLAKNQSVIRHYSKMVSLLTDKQVNPIYLSPVAIVDFNPIIELFFSWLLDEGTLVATKVHCMQTLANLSMRFQWIGDELLPTINYLEPKESVAFFARAKVVKKTLLKQYRNA